MEVLMHEASNGQGTNGTNAGNYIAEKQLVAREKLEAARIVENGVRFMETAAADTIDISFERISYTVSLGFRKGKKVILHEINGRLPGRRLTALMGPSGAGKSTLLDVLSGYKTTSVNGTVRVNGQTRDMHSFRKCSTYITQEDRLEPLLTVIENMRVAADLKLSTKIQRYEKETIIAEILRTLGLHDHVNTRTERLSGGQRKRLSIALELVNNPTVMFLDEPTTGLDSSSCMQVLNLLKLLARQGRTIVCTIHQPSASLYQLFDVVYVLGKGECLYHGATDKLVPYLENIKLPCPMYHNPADYIIELACGEYGEDKVAVLISNSQNGKNSGWFNSVDVMDTTNLKALRPSKKNIDDNDNGSLQATSLMHQMKILMQRGFLKTKRDTTLTHLRIIVNISVGFMLGSVFLQTGMDGARVLDNYNFLFSVLIHHMMTTMMLTIVTFPMQMSILLKEHFNRWYSLKAFYMSLTLIDLPLSVFCCLIFTLIVYFLTSQPLEMTRFVMFFSISLLISFIGQGTGLMIGAVFNVVNGTFLGPTLSVPLMMFAGFGVSLGDIPVYLKWGTYVSFLRYGLEGFICAIYGYDRPLLDCKGSNNYYCHYKYPSKFLSDITMDASQFWNDIAALVTILILTRISAYLLLKLKIVSLR